MELNLLSKENRMKINEFNNSVTSSLTLMTGI